MKMGMEDIDVAGFTEFDPSAETPLAEGVSKESLAMKDDGYDKYRKMLKAGLPMGAVMQKIASDGMDAAKFNVDAGANEAKKEEGSQASSVVAKPAAPAASFLDGIAGGGRLVRGCGYLWV